MRTSEIANLTEMERGVMTYLKDDGGWYNWGSEPGFSDVFVEELPEITNIKMSKLRGVLASLVKKELISLEDIDDRGHIIYPTFKTYQVYDEVTQVVKDTFVW